MFSNVIVTKHVKNGGWAVVQGRGGNSRAPARGSDAVARKKALGSIDPHSWRACALSTTLDTQQRALQHFRRRNQVMLNN